MGAPRDAYASTVPTATPGSGEMAARAEVRGGSAAAPGVRGIQSERGSALKDRSWYPGGNVGRREAREAHARRADARAFHHR
jgi:hypothetical protein